MTSPWRVLVVDDDETVRTLLNELLSLEGMDVRPAANGAEALALLETDDWRPHLIVLDLMMPVMDGWAFRTAQLARPDLRMIPVLLLTARTDQPADGGPIGAARAMAKPFDIDALLDTVRQLVETGTSSAGTTMTGAARLPELTSEALAR